MRAEPRSTVVGYPNNDKQPGSLCPSVSSLQSLWTSAQNSEDTSKKCLTELFIFFKGITMTIFLSFFSFLIFNIHLSMYHSVIIETKRLET